MTGSTSNEFVDQIVLQYLQKKGYQDAAKQLQQQLQSTSASSTTEQPAQLAEYATKLRLSTDACTANHVLFYGNAAGNPDKYEEAYNSLLSWICNSLDMYKTELYAVAYPLFVHCYLELVSKNLATEASRFFTKHASEHTRLHASELRSLIKIVKPEHLTENEYARFLLGRKYRVRMSMFSFELLNTFLLNSDNFLLLCIINERINLIVTENHPHMLVEETDESDILDRPAKRPLLATSPKVSVEKAADNIAKVLATLPNESNGSTQLVDSTNEMANLVHLAGGAGADLEDLHRTKVHWGVFPARRPIQEEETAIEGTAAEDKGKTPATSKKGSDNAKEAAVTPASAESTASPSTYSVEGKISMATAASATPETVPDRNSSYNTEILEKLVLRQSSAEKAQELEDLRVRVRVGKGTLPSTLCFTFANCKDKISSVSFSDDVTMVSAGFNDSSVHVWRNDDQPLGTLTGSMQSIQASDRSMKEEDGSHASLIGHSGPVYASSFSKDGAFLLSASADATVRLWSLATRSNVVCYRSHHYPVWDVKFSPVGYYFATASLDRTARLWCTDRLQPLRYFAGHMSDVDCVEFHPNANYLATGSSDRSVRLWDIQTGNCMRIFDSHYGAIRAIAFSPNGRLLASAGDDNFINIWDIASGKRMDTFVGHASRIHSLSFSQEGSVLASGSDDETVRLWDTTTLGVTAPTSLSQLNTLQSARVHVHKTSTSATSSSLLKVLRTRKTPVYTVQFTRRNLLLVGGCLVE